MKQFYQGLFAIIAMLASVMVARGQINVSAMTTVYTQNFDTLPISTSGGGNATNWADNSTVAGWYAAGHVNPITGNTGSSATPDLYSFGFNMNSERALGSITGNTRQTIIFGAQLSNGTGSTITSVTVTYDGEQWRNGTADVSDRLDFQYRIFGAGETASINASNAASSWIDLNALDFASFTFSLSQGSYVGTTANITGTIGGLALASGSSMWIRWVDSNVGSSGNMDDGLAVDNFRVSAIPEPSTYALLLGAAVAGMVYLKRRGRLVV